MHNKQNQSIPLKTGEFITEIDFPFSLKTSEGYYYEEKKYWEIKRNRTRNDLLKMDELYGKPISPYHVFHQFTFNSSLWTVPLDMAIMYGDKFVISNTSRYWHSLFHVMKLVFSEQCALGPRVYGENYMDINQCSLVWKVVAPTVFNWAMANGTSVPHYFIPQGYLDIEQTDKFYKKFEWHYDPKSGNISTVVEKFSDLWRTAKKPTMYKLFDGQKVVVNDYEEYRKVWIELGDMDFVSVPKEVADVGIMVPLLDCTYGRAIMGYAKYEQEYVQNGKVVEPEFDWTNKFFHECEHKWAALSEKTTVPLELRERLIGMEAVEHKVDFFVGLDPKSFEEAFTFSKEEITEFKKLDTHIRSYKHYGQYIRDPESIFVAFYKFELKAKFLKLEKEMLEKMGFSEDMLVDWQNLYGTFGVYQEVYDCSKLTIYMPRITGLVEITMKHEVGEEKKLIFGYPLTSQNMVKSLKMRFCGKIKVESFTLVDIPSGDRCRAEMGFENSETFLSCEKIILGCHHKWVSLSDKTVSLELRHRQIALEPAELKMDFFVGPKLTEKPFVFSKEDIEEFKKLDAITVSNQPTGQSILDDDLARSGFRKYQLKAKFVKFEKEMLEKMGFTKAMLKNWNNLYGDFGVYQEVYDCHKMEFYMPRISGLVNFTLQNETGDEKKLTFGFPLTKQNMVDTYTLMNTVGDMCRFTVGFNNLNQNLSCEKIFLGCEHKWEALSEKTVPYELRMRPVGMEQVEHVVDFFVGLTPKTDLNPDKQFILSKEHVEEFKKYDAAFVSKGDIGQHFMDPDLFFTGFRKYQLKAKFVTFGEKELKKMFAQNMPADWTNLYANYGIHQEVYDCPNMKFYMARISGWVEFTMPTAQGNQKTPIYGIPWTRQNMVDSYTLVDIGVGDRCRVSVGFNNLEKNKLACNKI